jgi:hypothetical protein
MKESFTANANANGNGNGFDTLLCPSITNTPGTITKESTEHCNDPSWKQRSLPTQQRYETISKVEHSIQCSSNTIPYPTHTRTHQHENLLWKEGYQQQRCGPHPSQIRSSSSFDYAQTPEVSDHPHQEKPVILQLRPKARLQVETRQPATSTARSTTGTMDETSSPPPLLRTNNLDNKLSIHMAKLDSLRNDDGTPTGAVKTLSTSDIDIAGGIVCGHKGTERKDSGNLLAAPTSPILPLLQLPFINSSPLRSIQQFQDVPSLQHPQQPQPQSLQQQQHQSVDFDYDQRTTELYQLIEQKQWNRLLQRLDEGEHDSDDDNTGKDNYNARRSSKDGAPSSSIRSQAAMWVVRKEANGRLRWRILPLHAAIIFRAPYTVIEAIVQSYPPAAGQKDDQGMLPLHLAMRNFNLQYNTSNVSNISVSSSQTMVQIDETVSLWRVVEELLTTYPQGIFCRDRKGRTSLQIGVQMIHKKFNNANGKTAQQSEIKERLQEVIKASISVLQLYDKIFNSGERINTSLTPSQQVHQQQHGNVRLLACTPNVQQSMLFIHRQHLETLEELRTMFYKQREDECRVQNEQKAILQEQLNASLERERQLQKELENVRRQLQQK